MNILFTFGKETPYHNKHDNRTRYFFNYKPELHKTTSQSGVLYSLAIDDGFPCFSIKRWNYPNDDLWTRFCKLFVHEPITTTTIKRFYLGKDITKRIE